MPILSFYNFVYLLVYLTVYSVCKSNATTQPISNFKDNALIHSSKCCGIDEHLILFNNTVKCSKHTDNNNRFKIVFATISNYSKNGDCEEDCIDFLEENGKFQLYRLFGAMCNLEAIQKYNYFPKCCPPDFTYDKSTHKCVHGNSLPAFGDYLQVMKIGLSECPVHDYAVADFEGSFDIDNDKKSIRMKSGESFNYGEFCIDLKHDMEKYLVRACLKSDVICGVDKRRCLWKCCPDGEIYIQQQNKSKKCYPSLKSEINLNAISENVFGNNEDNNNFAIISSNLKLGYKLYKHKPTMNFKVDSNGDIEMEIDHEMRYFDSTSMVYCIEQFQNNISTTQVLYLFHFGPTDNTEIFKSIILFTSALFSILTFLCYAILPEMQNLHGKCIMMECLFLLLGSAILCYTKVFPISQSACCTALGYGTIFAFLGLFAWLNIICVDMWMTFGVLRGFKVKNRKSELKKFIFYSCYGFGVPTAFVSFMILAQQTDMLPEVITPKIGKLKCYFDSDSNVDYMIYFLIPMAVMLAINVVLFVKTILYCIKVKNEIQRMRDDSSKERSKRKNTLKEDKEKMIMLLKLFLIMGILWIFETISSFISFKKLHLSLLETFIDTINCAKGIIIFCIFILKRNVLNLLAKKFGMKTTPRRSSEMTSLTLTTNTH